MPFFSNKFAPKKSPARKMVSSHNETEKAINDMMIGDSDCIIMHLGNNEIMFKKGTWTFESGLLGSVQRENNKLKKHIEKLNEEKNMVLLKFEILLNMCTQATAESHLKDREIEKIKNAAN